MRFFLDVYVRDSRMAKQLLEDLDVDFLLKHFSMMKYRKMTSKNSFMDDELLNLEPFIVILQETKENRDLHYQTNLVANAAALHTNSNIRIKNAQLQAMVHARRISVLNKYSSNIDKLLVAMVTEPGNMYHVYERLAVEMFDRYFEDTQKHAIYFYTWAQFLAIQKAVKEKYPSSPLNVQMQKFHRFIYDQVQKERNSQSRTLSTLTSSCQRVALDPKKAYTVRKDDKVKCSYKIVPISLKSAALLYNRFYKHFEREESDNELFSKLGSSWRRATDVAATNTNASNTNSNSNENDVMMIVHNKMYKCWVVIAIVEQHMYDELRLYRGRRYEGYPIYKGWVEILADEDIVLVGSNEDGSYKMEMRFEGNADAATFLPLEIFGIAEPITAGELKSTNGGGSKHLGKNHTNLLTGAYSHCS